MESQPSPSCAVAATASLFHFTVLRQLEKAGISSRAAPEEAPVEFECRIETALMALFRERREHQAFEALYELTRVSLLEWIAGLLAPRRRGDPLEILQDTYVNIYRYAGSFRDEHSKSFRVWSRTIAGNLIRRRMQRSRESSLHSLPEGLDEPADTRQDPPTILDCDEQRRSMLGAWMIVLSQYAIAYRELGARDQLALDLIEVQGLSYGAAGAQLRVGPSNMKMIMFRARRRLRARIGAALESRRDAERRIAV
jgi:RNA polymerase sigma factor (sigma-70 family)